MSEPEQAPYGTVEVMDFTVPTNVLENIRSRLPKMPTVYSIGCGVPAREPREIAALAERDIIYTGMDNDPSKIDRAQEFANRNWWSSKSQHKINANFVLADLTQKPGSEHVESADILVLNHPDVLGSEESLLSEEHPEKWKSIVQNGLSCLKKGGTAIITCFGKEELDLLEIYLEGFGLRTTHQQVNKQAQISENYAIIFACKEH